MMHGDTNVCITPNSGKQQKGSEDSYFNLTSVTNLLAEKEWLDKMQPEDFMGTNTGYHQYFCVHAR